MSEIENIKSDITDQSNHLQTAIERKKVRIESLKRQLIQIKDQEKIDQKKQIEFYNRRRTARQRAAPKNVRETERQRASPKGPQKKP